jgi:Cys-tRNA(Pro)/Cys-tRNA(Cys) deacylase
MKTNAIRKLEQGGIPHRLCTYDVDPDDLSAESVARKVGMPPEQVFKTLVVRGDKTGVFLAVIPGNTELDLKAAAKATGNRKVETVALREVQPLTGYVRGGVTALACKRDYSVVVDDTMEMHEEIAVSAGVRGCQMVLSPMDYVRVVAAQLADIARQKPE